MFNVDEIMTSVNNYLKKVRRSIDSNAVFKFGNTYIVNKNQIDDLLCCVEGCLPEEYKKLAKSKGRALDSNAKYRLLLSVIKGKFFIGSYYSVKYKETINGIEMYSRSLRDDLRNISNN